MADRMPCHMETNYGQNKVPVYLTFMFLDFKSEPENLHRISKLQGLESNSKPFLIFIYVWFFWTKFSPV